MENGPIKYVNVGDGVNHPLDAAILGGYPASHFQIKDNMIAAFSGFEESDVKYPSVGCICGVVGDVTGLTHFSIFNGSEYICEKHMTWIDFCNSGYNDGKVAYSQSEDCVYYNLKKIIGYGGDLVRPGDVIDSDEYIILVR